MTTTNQNIQKSLPLSNTEHKVCSRCRRKKCVTTYKKNGKVCSSCRMKTIVNKEVIKTEEHQRCTRKTRYLVTVMHDNFNEFNFCMVLSSRFDKELLYHTAMLSIRAVFGVCDVQIGRVSTWEADKMFEESDRLLAYTMEVDVLESLLGRYLLCIQDKMMEN
jgi:hypothetical protein